MKDGMEEVRNARKMRVELEEMKKRDLGNGGSRTTSRGQDREEITRLQGIIAQLQAQGSGRTGSKAKDYGDGGSNY
jgi:hypothetical protein